MLSKRIGSIGTWPISTKIKTFVFVSFGKDLSLQSFGQKVNLTK